MLGTLWKSLFGPSKVAELEVPSASGTASETLKRLIGEIRVLEPIEIRPESDETFLDAVLPRDRLEEFEVMLEGSLGKPTKAFDEKCKFPGKLDDLVDEMGGVDKDQCLFLRRFEDDRVLYGAFWPWGDPARITLKLGLLDEPYPAPQD